MRRSLFFNDIHPDEQVFTNSESAQVEETLERFKDGNTRGVRRGLRVTVNALDATRIDISPGQGYTPNGERVRLNENIVGLRLDVSTSLALTAEVFPVAVRGEGDYTLNARNYVMLRYTERSQHPLVERFLPVQHNTIVTGSFEIEVLEEAEFEALTSSDAIDVPGAPFPTTDPFPSRQFRILLAIVTTKGPSIPLTQADIQGVDPGVTQPVTLTGVRIVNVSSNTPPGTGFLRLRISEGSASLSWQAPSDSGEGAGVAVPDPNGVIAIQSATSTFTIVVDVVKASLPLIDTREAISVVTRLALTFPQASQPVVVTGAVIRRLSTNTSTGTGTLTYDSATKLMSWAAPGDTAGTGLDVSGGGPFILRSAATALFASVFVSETQLPIGLNPDTGLTVFTDEIDVRGLYDLLVAVQTADDILHRSYVGSGTPTPRNPHGTSFGDIAESTGDNPFETHQNRFHINGISVDAASDFLECSEVTTAGGDDAIQAQPPLSAADVYLIQGVSFNDLLPDPPQVVFNALNPTGYYLVYVDADGILTAIRAAALPLLTGVVTEETLPTAPHLRILDIYNTLAPNDGTVPGTLRYNPADQTFRWRAPGDDSAGENGFGVAQEAKADMRLVSANGDILRIGLDLTELITTGTTVNMTVTVLLDANVVNIENTLPLCMVLWDQTDCSFPSDFDLRRFATADNDRRVAALELDVTETRGTSPTLAHRVKDDRNRLLDNGISTHHEHDSVLDTDPNALLVELASPNSLVTVQQPDAATTFFYVDGREHTEVVDNSDPENDPPDFDYANDTNDDGTGPESVASVHQLYVDEFARLKNHVRVREDQDAQNKLIPGYVISTISNDWPAGSPTLDIVVNFPTTGFHTFFVTFDGVGDPVVTDPTQDGETWRLYAGDGVNWIEITRIGTIVAPTADATATFTVLAPLDLNESLELARISYDGSSEIIRIIDKRRFGTVGRRSLGSDALDFSKRIHDEYHSETRSDGVIRGLDLSFTGSDISWTGGVVDVGGNRYTIEAGTATNTVVNSSSNRRRYLYVNESGEVVLSSADVRQTLSGRRLALLAICYVQVASTTLEYAEDRRSFPGVVSTIVDRRYLDDAQVRGVFQRSGIDPAFPFSTDPDAAGGWWWNCHHTSTVDSQPPFWWLDDESKDGVFMVGFSSISTSLLPAASGLGLSDGDSHFIFFRVQAGPNPRTAANIEALGTVGPLLDTQEGDATTGVSVVKPTARLRFKSDDFEVTDLGDQTALVELETGDAGGFDSIGSTKNWDGGILTNGSVYTMDLVSWTQPNDRSQISGSVAFQAIVISDTNDEAIFQLRLNNIPLSVGASGDPSFRAKVRGVSAANVVTKFVVIPFGGTPHNSEAPTTSRILKLRVTAPSGAGVQSVTITDASLNSDGQINTGLIRVKKP